jgi:diguanylate cyclase (GGDEF)-like protein/PAS domain S-box-containing protein
VSFHHRSGGGPFAREGLPRRAWPFAAALLLGLVLGVLDPVRQPAVLAAAGAVLVLIAVTVVIVPWTRRPAGERAAPALLCLLFVALLTESGGGAGSGFFPLLTVAVLWVALYETRLALLVVLLGAVLALAVPFVVIGPPDYPTSEVRRMVLWVVVAWLIGTTVQRLVRSVRAGAAAGEALKQAVVESALDCVVTMDHRGRVLEFNPAAERTFGYRREQAIGTELADLIVPPSLRDAHRRGVAHHLETGEETVLNQRLELTGMRADGDEFPVELTITRITAVEPPMFTGYMRDLTERRRAERDAAAQHRVAQALAESASSEDAIAGVLSALGESMGWDLGAAWLVDQDAALLRCQALWQQPEIDATEFRRLTEGLTFERGHGPLGRAWASGAVTGTERVTDEPQFPRARAAARLGLRGAVWVPIRSADEILGVLEFYSRRPNPADETVLAVLASVGSQFGEFLRRRRAEERLAHQALHDELTGLPNRGLLLDRLRHALARAGRDGSTVCVLFLDLDDFKLVNDTLGHAVGDELLVAVAARLRTALRDSDTVGRLDAEMVARFGGDEFVILCEGLDHEGDAVCIAERLGRELARPIVLADRELVVTASLGLALSAGERSTPDALVRDADAAMYRAKERGRGLYEIFDEATRSRVLARLGMETELRRALERDELRLFYQPIVTLQNGAIPGVEALVRWQHPDRGLIGPADFIPFAEQSTLIHSIGRWVLDEACRQAARWSRERPGLPAIAVSVNLSSRQLADRHLVTAIAATLDETGVDPGLLTLEITESLLVQDMTSAVETLEALKALGVRLSLDDFGTGYSSLSYLTALPLDVLKLDRSFVSQLGTDADPAIVAAVCEMAVALGMTVVAEGVELPAQLAILRELGCRFAQGYLFARPLPPEELREVLDAGFGHLIELDRAGT